MAQKVPPVVACRALIAGAFFLGAFSLAGTATAAPKASGCFARTYDAAHMRDNRSQHVQRLWLRLDHAESEPGKASFGMQVWVRGKPQIWRAGGQCERAGESWICEPDTDGASRLLLQLREGKLHVANPGKLKIQDDRTGPDLNDMNVGGRADAAFVLRPARTSICKDASP